MREVFPIVPAPASTVLVSLALLLPVLLILLYLVLAPRLVRFELSPEGLAIRGELYGRRIPARELIVDHARPVDLRTDTDRRLARRTNGVGLPGYRSGWFRLANGEKALVFVTDQSRVVYIPTRRGYAVLLSVERPEEFINRLRLATFRG
mgnify:CR=1 FL=1